MADDLLSKIDVEMRERMRALRPAVDEHERLLADLRALEGEPNGAGAREPVHTRPLVSPKVMRLMG